MEDNPFFKRILIALTVGVWVIVLQNAGIFPQLKAHKVTSDGTMQVSGEVSIPDVIMVKGKVDANIESINGYSKFYKDPRTGQYYVLPVTDPYE